METERGDVKVNLLYGSGSPGPEVNIDADQRAKSWILRLRPPEVTEFRRLNQLALESRWRQERFVNSQDRLVLAGWIFLGVTALLAASAGYGRLMGRRNATAALRGP